MSPIVGWCTTDIEPRSLEIRLGGRPIEHRVMSRPDVKAAFPSLYAVGFAAVLDLSQHLENTRDGSLTWSVAVDGVVQSNGTLAVAPDAIQHAKTIDQIRRGKRDWLKQHICCPFCRRPDTLRTVPGEIECRECGSLFPQRSRAFNLLPPQSGINPEVAATENIPVSGYDDVAREIMQTAYEKSGMVLDCGAGLKTHLQPQVITLEIVDYPSTDVLGVGEHLPFPDGIFDAVFSFAVLEHVASPFRCASEIMRVLKPGGLLYCQVPFLQPEHGYPDHYYNMTRSGLRHLFADNGAIERHWVPQSGQPFYSLHWILGMWNAHLPEAVRERFRSLTVGELIAHPVEHYLAEDFNAKLSDDGKWILASTTAMLVRKPADSL